LTNLIDIDIYYANLNSFLAHVSDNTNLTSIVISENGPAGGNPLVRISGTYDEITSLLAYLYPNDTDHVSYLASRITQS
jgi:hypothetical protein